MFEGLADRKNCSSPVEKPGTFAGYPISDTQLGVRFTKPITNDFDYLLFHKLQQDHGLIESRYWPTYGPIWSDVVENLQPDKYYTLAVRLTCSRNSSIRSNADQDTVSTFKTRKVNLKCFVFSKTSINVHSYSKLTQSLSFQLHLSQPHLQCLVRTRLGPLNTNEP